LPSGGETERRASEQLKLAARRQGGKKARWKEGKARKRQETRIASPKTRSGQQDASSRPAGKAQEVKFPEEKSKTKPFG